MGAQCQLVVDPEVDPVVDNKESRLSDRVAAGLFH